MGLLIRSVERSGKLSVADRKLVLAQFDSSSIVNRHSAILVLDVASKANVFPRSRLLALIEQRCIAIEGREAELYAADFARCSCLPVPPDGPLDTELWRIRDKHKSAATIDAEERSLVDRSMAIVGKESNRVFEQILIPKQNLDPASFRWGLGRIDRGILKTHGSTKVYWTFLRRVFAARSRTRNPQTVLFGETTA